MSWISEYVYLWCVYVYVRLGMSSYLLFDVLFTDLDGG